MALFQALSRFVNGNTASQENIDPNQPLDTGVTIISGIDPRATSEAKLIAPAPLPHISRRSLKRVKHRVPVPDTCPYCGNDHVELVEHKAVYKRSYGEWPYLYLCRNQACGAYVGVHPHTDIPLGTLADLATREARKANKSWFMRLMKRQQCGLNIGYLWLSEEMNIRAEQCHWSMFDVDLCEQAGAICKAKFEDGTILMPKNFSRSK